MRIYHTPSHGCDSFTLSYYQDGIRKRPTFPTFKAAEREARLVARRLGKSDADVLALKSADRLAYLRAKELLDPLSLPLEIAAAEYAEARRRLGPTPLRQAVEFYLKRNPAVLECYLGEETEV